MKYCVLGCNQQKAVELGLDLLDLALLDWLRDFVMSDKIKRIRRNGKTLYWVDYQTLLEDMPILGVQKHAIREHFKKLERLEIIVHYNIKEGGNYSYYGFGKRARSLYYHSNRSDEGLRSENNNLSILKSQGLRIQNTNKDYPTSNPPTISIIDKKEKEKSPRTFQTFEERRARYEQ